MNLLGRESLLVPDPRRIPILQCVSGNGFPQSARCEKGFSHEHDAGNVTLFVCHRLQPVLNGPTNFFPAGLQPAFKTTQASPAEAGLRIREQQQCTTT